MTASPAENIAIPPGPRRPAAGPSVWTGNRMAAGDDWIYRLTDGHVAELEGAVHRVRERGLEVLDVSRTDFPLPTLGRVLAELSREIVDGRGFVLIEGVPVTRYDRLGAALAFWGVGLHLGDPVSQNGKGHLLGHVKDLGYARGDPNFRGYQTSESLSYHTDSCDIVGLMCLAKSKAGGLSSIVSSAAVHNEILRRRPDLLEALYQSFYISRINEVPKGQRPWFPMPVFNDHAGHITSMYPRRDMRMGHKLPGVPPLSDLQLAALALLDDVCEELSLKMEIELGDMQFLHNHAIYHGRTAYEDWPEPERRRHMLRLWLSSPRGRELPGHFAARYGPLDVGAVRGGIVCPGTRHCAPLEAE